MAKKGVFVAFRLHPDNEMEREAMAIYESLQKQGFSPRQIGTDALLRLANKKPEMFQDYSKQVTKPYLEALLEDFASHILQEVRTLGLSTQAPTHNETPLTEDSDSEYEKNLVAGYMARRRR